MTVWGRRAPVRRGLIVLGVLAFAGCGSDANLKIDNNAKCDGRTGPKVTGVVRLPNGRLAAQTGGFAARLAALAVAPVDALTGHVSPARSVRVELVELRPEDIANGSEPGALATAVTNSKGEFCVPLARGTTVDVCRYMLRVGNAGAGTRTRAFVYSTDQPIDVDYASEATVGVILNVIPPGDLCGFTPDEIADIHQAVRAVPGDVVGATTAEVNALATTMAAVDAEVHALLVEAGNLPPPTATRVPGAPTATAVAPAATATRALPPGTRTSRPTRTPLAGSPTATRAPTNTRTAAAVTGSPTATGPAATATRAANTATPTETRRPPSPTPSVTGAGATSTPTRTAVVGPSNTPTPTTVPGTPAAGLGERVFTIREDSMFPGPNPRSGFFSSGLGGQSITDKLSAGPIVLVAGEPGADGIASLSLKQDAYFKMNLSPARTTLCVRMRAAGSSGQIDCNGGTAFDIELTAPAGNVAAPPPVTGLGADGGAGAATLTVQQAIVELVNFTDTCDATLTFPENVTAIYTTTKFTATKGLATVNRPGENFDCGAWTTTDGVGMLVNGVVASDPRVPGGNVANITRLADM